MQARGLLRGKKASIALDYWKDIRGRSYLGVTACALAEPDGGPPTKVSFALVCKEMEALSSSEPGMSKSNVTYSTVVDALRTANLSLTDVVQIVSDGAESKAADLLAEKSGGAHTALWCGAHLFNLVQQDAVRQPPLIHLLRRIGELIAFLRRGRGREPLRQAQLKRLVPDSGEAPRECAPDSCSGSVSPLPEQAPAAPLDLADLEQFSDNMRSLSPESIDSFDDSPTTPDNSGALGKHQRRPLEMITYTPIRWYSLTNVLSRLVDLKEALAEMEGKGELPIEYCLSTDDWVTIAAILPVQQAIAKVIGRLESDSTCTFPLFYDSVFVVYQYVVAYIRRSDLGISAPNTPCQPSAVAAASPQSPALEYCRAIVESIEVRFLGAPRRPGDRRHPFPLCPAAATAMALNPYARPALLPKGLESRWNAAVEEYLRSQDSNELGTSSEEQLMAASESSPPEAANSPSVKRHKGPFRFDAFEASLFAKDVASQSPLPSVSPSVDEYRDFHSWLSRTQVSAPPDRVIPFLHFWSEGHGKNWKRLSTVAITLATTTASSASVERLFSCAGLTVTDQRSSLSAETAEQLIVTFQNTKELERLGLLDQLETSVIDGQTKRHRQQ